MSELAVGSIAGLAANNFVVDVASGSKLVQPGMILQVVQTVKTDTFISSSTSYTDVTGLSVSITPTSASSKILVSVTANFGASANCSGGMQVVRDSTAIGSGASAGSRVRASQGFRSINDNHLFSIAFDFLDDPNTTSATTYKIQGRIETNNFTLNRTAADVDNASYHRGASTITLMEVAG